MNMRNLETKDYKNYLELLYMLKPFDISSVSKEKFERFINYLNDKHIVLVLEIDNKLVATGTILIERKIYGKVAHVEDIVVDNEYRGKRYGSKILDGLNKIAKEKNCYKLVLNCSKSNVSFYVNNNYVNKEETMIKYL